MGRLLRDADVPHATVDFDQLTACYPRLPDDDGWGTNLGLTNLAALWRNYSARGAGRLLLARVIEDRTELDGYRAAVPGAEIVVVRLRASPATLQERVRRRGEGRGIEWHLKPRGRARATDGRTACRGCARGNGGAPPGARRGDASASGVANRESRRRNRSSRWTRGARRTRWTLNSLRSLSGRSADPEKHQDQERPDQTVVVVTVILRDRNLRRSCVIS